MRKILFADDGVTVMNLSGPLLGDPDLELDVVTDGRTALDRLAATPDAYNLVILGYDLPEISGPDCAAFIRKLLRRLPVLVLTDPLDQDQRDELASAGVIGHHILEKPADAESFSAWVKGALAQAPPRRPKP